MKLHQLTVKHLRDALHWQNEITPSSQPVLYLTINHPEAGKLRAYAKLQKEGEGVKRTLNELTGWALAAACGLPTCEYAGTITLPYEALPYYQGSPPPVTQKKPLDFFWCSEIDAVQLTIGINCQTLAEKLLNWAHAADTIALDAWTGNNDRHINNMVFSGNEKEPFYLIDHGHLCGSTPDAVWTPESLADPLAPQQNVLLKNITAAAAGKQTPASSRQFTQACAAAQKHRDRDALSKAQFPAVAKQLTIDEKSSFDAYLSERLKHAALLLADLYSQLPEAAPPPSSTPPS